MSGTPSHDTKAKDGSVVTPNTDGSSIIANNIISDFGYGDSCWIWEDANRSPFCFDTEHEEDTPLLNDVIISVNVVQDSGSMVPTEQTTEPPRYNYTMFIAGDPDGKKTQCGLHVQNNILPAGQQGVATMTPPNHPRRLF